MTPCVFIDKACFLAVKKAWAWQKKWSIVKENTNSQLRSTNTSYNSTGFRQLLGTQFAVEFPHPELQQQPASDAPHINVLHCWMMIIAIVWHTNEWPWSYTALLETVILTVFTMGNSILISIVGWSPTWPSSPTISIIDSTWHWYPQINLQTNRAVSLPNCQSLLVLPTIAVDIVTIDFSRPSLISLMMLVDPLYLYECTPFFIETIIYAWVFLHPIM